MKRFLNSAIGRLRIIGFIEGISLLILVFVAVPLKYIMNEPTLVQSIGPVHGALFLLFIFSALRTGIEQRWSFRRITWKVLLACIVPFGTFYIDYAILRHMHPLWKREMPDKGDGDY